MANIVPARSLQHLDVHCSPQACLAQRPVSSPSQSCVDSQFSLGKAEGATTPPVSWEGVTTPPIPSSSPCYGGDSMDISPLPHKAPFAFSTTINVPSPTPEAAVDDDMISPCEPVANTNLEVPQTGRVLEYVVVPCTSVDPSNTPSDESDRPSSDPASLARDASLQPAFHSFRSRLKISCPLSRSVQAERAWQAARRLSPWTNTSPNLHRRIGIHLTARSAGLLDPVRYFTTPTYLAVPADRQSTYR
jgi:hypothetical protein